MPERCAFDVMGTVVSIDVRDEIAGDAIAEVRDWLHHVDAVFSPFKPDSEVSRFARGEIDVVAQNDDLAFVIAACERLFHETDGYFDAYARGAFDPSGFVKGWAIERASAMLVQAGSRHHMINAGGDIRVRGDALPDDGWRIGVVHPADRKAFSTVVEIRDAAIATSGSSERGLHVFDPHRGAPAAELASVTIVGPDLTSTDAYATAALAMGRRATDWLASIRGYESWVVDARGFVWHSDGFPSLMTAESAPAR